MPISFKKILAASICGVLTSSAIAADGVINFTGEITAVTCSIKAGAGTTVTGAPGSQIVAVSLGKVSIDSLSHAGPGNSAANTVINLLLDCGNTATGLSAVHVKFDPLSGSGIDLHDNKLLKVNGTAQGVGVGIYNSDNTLLNLSANDMIDAPLDSGSGMDATTTATISMRATYVANGEKIAPGTANANLPFTLTYQ